MRLRIRLFPPLREAVGKKEIEFEAKGDRLSDLVRELSETYPKLGEDLYEAGALSPYITYYVNSKPVPILEADGFRLADGDEVLVMMPITGGAGIGAARPSGGRATGRSAGIAGGRSGRDGGRVSRANRLARLQ
ncbi:MAG: MoaD/ThiS family protein [Methanobacteriota archaeon]